VQYTISDLDGDLIVVMPGDKDGLLAKVVLAFLDTEDGSELAMILDDRGAKDLITAMTMALKESERMG
jgi:hypothetical protein